jgi:hypothetical protein
VAEQRVFALEEKLTAGRAGAGAGPAGAPLDVIDVDALPASNGTADDGGGGGSGGGGGRGAGSDSGLAQLHALDQRLLQVKHEKDELGEELEDKGELCQQVALSEDRKNDVIDRLKARLRAAGVPDHEINALV